MLREVAVALLVIEAAGCGGGQTAPPTTVDLAPPPPSVAAPSASAVASSSAPRKSSGSIPWEKSEPEARERARKRGLPLVIFACASWAADCRTMERDVWTDPRVVGLAPRFVWVKIDLTETEGDAELTAQRLGIVAVPMTMVVEPDGTTTYVEKRAASPDVMARALASAANAPPP